MFLFSCPSKPAMFSPYYVSQGIFTLPMRHAYVLFVHFHLLDQTVLLSTSFSGKKT